MKSEQNERSVRHRSFIEVHVIACGLKICASLGVNVHGDCLVSDTSTAKILKRRIRIARLLSSWVVINFVVKLSREATNPYPESRTFDNACLSKMGRT
jgi:hypothetical protein